jgi:hypothetical protein
MKFFLTLPCPVHSRGTAAVANSGTESSHAIVAEVRLQGFGEFPVTHRFQFEFLLPHPTRRLHSARFRHLEMVAFYFPVERLRQLSICEDF